MCVIFSFLFGLFRAYIHSLNIIWGDGGARNVVMTIYNVCKIIDFGMSKTLEYRTPLERPEYVVQTPGQTNGKLKVPYDPFLMRAYLIFCVNIAGVFLTCVNIAGVFFFFSFSKLMMQLRPLLPVNHAPQELRNVMRGETHLTAAVDTYIFGMTCIEISCLAVGESLYVGKTADEIKAAVLAGEIHTIPPNVTASMADLIRACLEFNPEKRPPMEHVVADMSAKIPSDGSSYPITEDSFYLETSGPPPAHRSTRYHVTWKMPTTTVDKIGGVFGPKEDLETALIAAASEHNNIGDELAQMIESAPTVNGNIELTFSVEMMKKFYKCQDVEQIVHSIDEKKKKKGDNQDIDIIFMRAGSGISPAIFSGSKEVISKSWLAKWKTGSKLIPYNPKVFKKKDGTKKTEIGLNVGNGSVAKRTRVILTPKIANSTTAKRVALGAFVGKATAYLQRCIALNNYKSDGIVANPAASVDARPLYRPIYSLPDSPSRSGSPRGGRSSVTSV